MKKKKLLQQKSFISRHLEIVIVNLAVAIWFFFAHDYRLAHLTLDFTMDLFAGPFLAGPKDVCFVFFLEDLLRDLSCFI